MTFLLHAFRPFCMTLLTAACLPAFNAQAQPAEKPIDSLPVSRPAHPQWLLEQPYADNPMLIARTYGESTYGDHRANATLQISCHPQNRDAGFALEIAPSSLGFDSDPFEGPGATAHGPLHITIGKHTSVDYQVAGSWNHGSLFQVGTLFTLSTRIPHDGLSHWVSDAARGQLLNLSLAPATADGKPLTAKFSLPENNDGLKQVIQLCLFSK